MSIQNYLFISSTDNYLPEYLLYILVVPIKYEFKEKNIVQKFLAEVPSFVFSFVYIILKPLNCLITFTLTVKMY